MTISTVYTYPLNGTARDFSIPFEYLARRFVVVTLIGTNRKELSITTDFRFTSKTSIQTTKVWAQADGYELIEIRRNTSVSDRLVDFADGSILRAYELNIAQVQTLHVAEEARNMVADTIGVNNDGMLDARARKIVNLADATQPGDAVTLRQEQVWAGSALNQADRANVEANRSTTEAGKSASSAAAALASQNAAKTSETNSKNSENAAKTSETNSKNSENAAKTSETNSKNSEVAAQGHRNAAATSETNAKSSEVAAAGYAAGVNLPSAQGQGGRMLQVKADGSGYAHVSAYTSFGIGQHGFNPVPGGDIDSLNTSGTFATLSTTSGTFPGGSPVAGTLMHAERGSSGSATQWLDVIRGTGAAQLLYWRCRRTDGSWTGWAEQWSSASLPIGVTGRDLVGAATSAGARASLGIKRYDSGLLSFVRGGALLLSTGFGERPDHVSCRVVFNTAMHGYLAGDELPLVDTTFPSTSASFGMTAALRANGEIAVRIAGNGFAILNGSTGTALGLPDTDLRLRIIATR